MSKISRENKKKITKQVTTDDTIGSFENQNQEHNAKKEALGQNTKR